MTDFGWSYPAGCSSVPGDEEDVSSCPDCGDTRKVHWNPEDPAEVSPCPQCSPCPATHAETPDWDKTDPVCVDCNATMTLFIPETPMPGQHLNNLVSDFSAQITHIHHCNRDYVPIKQEWKQSQKGFSGGGFRLFIEYPNGRQVWIWPDAYSVLEYWRCSDCAEQAVPF